MYHFATLEDPLTPCQKQYQECWRNPVAGRSVPLCKPDGTYSKVQCYLSTCYCVDTNGNQIRGTSVNSLRDGLPNCDDDPGTLMIWRKIVNLQWYPHSCMVVKTLHQRLNVIGLQNMFDCYSCPIVLKRSPSFGCASTAFVISLHLKVNI